MVTDWKKKKKEKLGESVEKEMKPRALEVRHRKASEYANKPK